MDVDSANEDVGRSHQWYELAFSFKLRSLAFHPIRQVRTGRELCLATLNTFDKHRHRSTLEHDQIALRMLLLPTSRPYAIIP